jgi:hypothetical protein
VRPLHGHEIPSSAQDVIERLLIQIGLRALELAECAPNMDIPTPGELDDSKLIALPPTIS